MKILVGACVLAINLCAAPAASADDSPGVTSWTGKMPTAGGTMKIRAIETVQKEARTAHRAPARYRYEFFRFPNCAPDAPTIGEGWAKTCEAKACKTWDGRQGLDYDVAAKKINIGSEKVVARSYSRNRCLTEAPATSLAEAIRRQMRVVHLPVARAQINPSPWTLVNWHNTFTADVLWKQRSIGPILGHRVTLLLKPVRYRWTFGDGTARAGERRTTYAYTRSTGAMKVQVDVTYRASYRVDNGRARQIPGTITVPGKATTLEVYEARSQLVAGADG